MEAVIPPIVVAVAAVLACILVAVLVVMLLYQWEQVIESQVVTVQRCRWGGFWGNLVCFVFWLTLIIEIIFFVLVCFAALFLMIMNIIALIGLF